MYYQTSMEGLAANGLIQAGFALLTRAEASGLLSHSDNDCYPMFHILLEACRLTGHSKGASRVQAMVEQLGLIALAPLATVVVQGSVRWYKYGLGGEGVADAQQLWLELRQQTAYKPRLQALPWVFAQRSTCEQQEGLLQLYVETKLLTMLLSYGEAELNIPIDLKNRLGYAEFRFVWSWRQKYC